MGTTAVRFLLPVPVLWGSIKGVMRDAEFHHGGISNMSGVLVGTEAGARVEPAGRSALSIKLSVCYLRTQTLAAEERANLVRLLRRSRAARLGVRDRAEARAVGERGKGVQVFWADGDFCSRRLGRANRGAPARDERPRGWFRPRRRSQLHIDPVARPPSRVVKTQPGRGPA